jgi:hypothetical protein
MLLTLVKFSSTKLYPKLPEVYRSGASKPFSGCTVNVGGNRRVCSIIRLVV